MGRVEPLFISMPTFFLLNTNIAMRALTKHIVHINHLLRQDGIHFSFDDSISKGKRLENIIYSRGVGCTDSELLNGVKEYKLYEGVFFRDFGQAIYYDNRMNTMPITDEMFYKDLMETVKQYLK